MASLRGQVGNDVPGVKHTNIRKRGMASMRTFLHVFKQNTQVSLFVILFVAYFLFSISFQGSKLKWCQFVPGDANEATGVSPHARDSLGGSF